MDTKILEEIGLTQGEVKVYLALLETGQTSAGAILEKAKVQNSVFHFCVNKLIEKGLVSYVKKGKVRMYKAATPESLISYLKDKQKEVELILPELKAKQSTEKETHEAEVFDGNIGVITALNILIEGTRKSDEFLFFSADVDEKNEEIQQFYERFDAKRKAKGLVSKGVAPFSLKHLFNKRKALYMKYSKSPIPPNMGVCNDKMILISWGEKPKAVLIQSKEIADKQKEFFKAFWDKL